jgi:tRNA(Arg) A34 adenosine deaminase TadA
VASDARRRLRGDARLPHRDTRRATLARLVGLGALLAAPPARASSAAQPAAIAQPPAPGPAAFMERALELRRRAVDRGDQPFGAVIVHAGRIVGEGASGVLTTPDPTAHAEIEAIRDAARRLRTADLSGAEMYGTARACPMCQAAAYWARLARLWHGESLVDGGAPRLP